MELCTTVHCCIYSWLCIQGQPLCLSLWASKQQQRAPDGSCLGRFVLLSPLPRKCAIFYFIFLGNSGQGLNCILACRQQTKLPSEPKSPFICFLQCHMHSLSSLGVAHTWEDKQAQSQIGKRPQQRAGSRFDMVPDRESCSSQGTVVTHRQQWWLHPEAGFLALTGLGQMKLKLKLRGSSIWDLFPPFPAPAQVPAQTASVQMYFSRGIFTLKLEQNEKVSHSSWASGSGSCLLQPYDRVLLPQRIGLGREHAVPPEEEQRDVCGNSSTDISLCSQVLFSSDTAPASPVLHKKHSQRITRCVPSELGESSKQSELFLMPTQAASQTPALLPPWAIH